MNQVTGNCYQGIGDYMGNMNVRKSSQPNNVAGDSYYANNNARLASLNIAYQRPISNNISVLYGKTGDSQSNGFSFNYGDAQGGNKALPEIIQNKMGMDNTSSGSIDNQYFKNGTVLNAALNDRANIEYASGIKTASYKTFGSIPVPEIHAAANRTVGTATGVGVLENATTGHEVAGTGLTAEYAPGMDPSSINKSKSNYRFDVSSMRNSNHSINSSNWKEWNSYSKLLPLAVVELDVQSECNYLSSLFNLFSNTIKGFISSSEFEKLMDYVNIIEIGYRGTIFGVMDRNQDEYITEVEFLTGMLIFRPYNPKEKNAKNFNKLRLQFIFFYYDSNRDGVLSIDELAKLIEHISIIKVTISSDKHKKKTHISSERSIKLAKQIINDYLSKMYCSYDDFYSIVNNGILNGTTNLLRCRNDIFIQKNNFIKYNNTKDLKALNNSPQSFVNNVYNTPLNEPVERASKIDSHLSAKFSCPSPYTHSSFNRSTNPYQNQNIGDHINTHNDNYLNYPSNIFTNTPNHGTINSINSTVTRKNNQIFGQNSISPANNSSLYTPDAFSNYRSTFDSASPYYNIPSEGHTNFHMSPYYR